MTERRADVVVVGAGIMGASAAWHLACRGLRTVLLEQYELNHQRGSSHGSARIFRLVYDIPEYIELARRALPLWRDAERELDEELLWTTGGLDIGPPGEIAALSTVLTASDVRHEILSPSQLADRFPAFQPVWKIGRPRQWCRQIHSAVPKAEPQAPCWSRY